MPLSYMLHSLWRWIAEQGITLALIVVVAMMIPRMGRFAMHVLNRRIEESDDTLGKTRMAITGAVIYIVQLIAYFLLFVAFLSTLGFALSTAAIPATVVSAALGFGAQSLIADFLAGFFIITEKQFGIGDWVRFEGSGVTVEGTVTSITMRSTRIRTLAEETVIIPNSTAKVCINSSNYWSRAVVTMPIPLVSTSNLDSSLARARHAAASALEQPEIADTLIGELDIQPAVDVTPPTALGTPWTIKMRFLIQVEAGSQYAVERAIRAALLTEFWDEYGAAASAALLGAGEEDGEGQASRSPSHAARDAGAGDDTATMILGQAAATDPAAHPNDEDLDTKRLHAPDLVSAGPDEQDDACAADAADEDSHLPAWRRKIRRALSVGGRMRPSTSVLILLMALLLFLRGSTVTTGENWNGSDGWLAPRSPETATTEPAEPSPEPSPEYNPGTTASEPTWQHNQGTVDTSSYPTDSGSGQNGGDWQQNQATPTAGNAEGGTDSDSTPTAAEPTDRGVGTFFPRTDAATTTPAVSPSP